MAVRRWLSTSRAVHGGGYKGFGSFHSDNLDDLLAQADRDDYTPPPVPTAVQAMRSRTPPAYADDPSGDPYGHALRARDFLLDSDWCFVNHGAFGAPCRAGIAAAAGWRMHAERQPLRFIDRELFPQLAEVSRCAASFAGAARAADIALVPNATHALNAVVDSVERDGRLAGDGDAILLLDGGYGSVAQLARRACGAAAGGARVVTVPVLDAFRDNTSADAVDAAVLERVEGALRDAGGRVRLAVFDHVASNSAVALPVRALAELCRQHGALSLVDGAHGPAQHLGGALGGVAALGCDFYAANLHKWFHAPRGVGFLWAAPEHQAWVVPPVVSHGYETGGFAARFAWQGANDPAAWLAVPDVLRWWDALGGHERAAKRNHALLARATALLGDAWGGGDRLFAPLPSCGNSMALVELPEGAAAGDSTAAKAVQDALHFDHGVEMPIKSIDGRLYARVSCAVYNELSDYEKVADTVLEAVR